MSEATTPQSFVFGILLLFIFLLAVTGVLIGYFLAKKVRSKYMAIGSVIYWTITLLYLSIDGNLVSSIFLSIFLVLFLNIAYIITKYRQMHTRT